MSTKPNEVPTAADAADQPTTPADSAPARLTIIGIGASAGGQAALQAFFQAVPPQTGLTFVIVVHLSPTHESHLAQLLQPSTSMPVIQVTEPVSMQPDHVYVIPPAKQLVVRDGRLDVTDFEQPRHRLLQIDVFFRSLAQEYGDGAAIILSGGGSDGAVGIQAIKERGGLLLVQALEEAEYDSMPRSAIATGLVDIVAPAAELARQLVAAKQTHAALQLPPEAEALSDATQQTLLQILAQVRVRLGHDFSGYKSATMLRRIARRMQLTQLATLTEYLHRLRQDSAEADALFRDLLIHVTEFFRDAEAWAALEATLIPQLFAGKGRDHTVRVWVAGCATGEEAYSLAMLLLEYADTLVSPPTLQLFASDLSQPALEIARAGAYPAAIATDVSAERLARFFTQENSHYRVRPELRERILFTQHNLLQDAPFSKLDLVVCRNLLIYLQSEVQERVFATFAYALQPGGYLFLGSAESVDASSERFALLDKHQRLYQRRPHPSGEPLLPGLALVSSPVRLPAVATEPARAAQPPGEEHRLMLEAVAPPSILVTGDHTVLHLSESAGRYLLSPGGTPTADVLRLVRPELQAELGAALLRALADEQAVATRPVPVRLDGARHAVSLMVRPHRLANGQLRALVIFLEEDTPLPLPGEASGSSIAAEGVEPQRTAEVRQLQHQLQRMREQYETTLEELGAANEELQSTNEEYRATLEELETSKEELQSTNEELQTVNQELKTKIEEVSQAHGDLQNLFVATDIATLFLDRELRIKRYTPAANELFHLQPTDSGRPIGHFRGALHYEALEADARQVLKDLTPLERELQGASDRWFLLRMRPYRTLEERIDGLVLTFVDITASKVNERALQAAKEYAESIVYTIPDALLVLQPDLRVQTANEAFYTIFQARPEQTEGQRIYELGNGQWDIPALRTLLEEILPHNQVFSSYEVTHEFADIGRRTMLLNGRQLDHVQLILLAITDITARKQAEAALQQLTETLEQQVAERTAALRTSEVQLRALASQLTMAEQAERRRIAQILHDDLQQRLYGVRMLIQVVREETAAQAESELATYAQQCYDLLGEAIGLTRQLAVDLSPPVLQEEGLVDMLQWLANQMVRVNGLQVEVRAAHNFVMPDADMRVLLYQCVRELLFNVVKHGQTNQATVALTDGEAGYLRIQVSDEGQGFEVAAAEARHEGGFGLFSVRERLTLFSGQMTIDAAPGQGTRITLAVPQRSAPARAS